MQKRTSCAVFAPEQWGPFLIPYFHRILFFFLLDTESNHQPPPAGKKIPAVSECIQTLCPTRTHTEVVAFSWSGSLAGVKVEAKTESALFVPKSLSRAAMSAPIPLSCPSGTSIHIKFTTSCTGFSGAAAWPPNGTS